MILHTVAFRLRHAKGSQEERAFFEAAKSLTRIPGVQNFEQFRQVSQKNGFTYGFSMVFADQRTYDAYNAHPDHAAWIRDQWLVDVEDFLELDYTPI
jgi:Stress responsive A/B Barrel Domain